jgi:acyl-CoA synthetase (NDP forming)
VTNKVQPPTSPAPTTALDAIFQPRSIAVIGATERAGYGARVLSTLLRANFDGTIYPINPRYERVFDLPCYASPGHLPAPVDLVVVVVPAIAVAEALRKSAAAGARAAIVISAGFAELGDDGAARQTELLAIAAATGLRIVGPNCLGAANLADGIWPTAATRLSVDLPLTMPGAALVSQSGATAFGPLLAMAADRGLGFRYVVTTGNEADLVATDFVEYFLALPDVRVVALMLEGLRDFARLRRLAAEAARRGKFLVMLKVGRSAAGARAAHSHTAALTGSDEVHDALLHQLGIVRVRDYDELIEQSAMLLHAVLPSGPRMGVASHSGGIGAHLCDLLGVEGLQIPDLGGAVRTTVGKVLGERGSAANPADLTTFANGPQFRPLLDALFADEGLDAWVVATQGNAQRAQVIVEAAQATHRPVSVAWTGSQNDSASLEVLRAGGVPVFALPSGAARGAAALSGVAATRRRRELDAALAGESSPKPTLDIELGAGGTLSEHASKQVLAHFGIESTAEHLCSSLDEAKHAATQLGYPLVLKANVTGIVHKSEYGLVRLDVRREAQMFEAFNDLETTANRITKGRLEGILVQAFQPDGIETIIGIADDPDHGRLLMLGLGGTLVEAIGAVTWRASPIGPHEAQAMIDEVPALNVLLNGVRGRAAADRPALVAALTKLSTMAETLGDRLETVDVNPLLVRAAGLGVLALDALVVLRESK